MYACVSSCRYEDSVREVTRSLKFMKTIVGDEASHTVNQAPFYTSHEGACVHVCVCACVRVCACMRVPVCR